MDWQDIGTAPRNGTRILVCVEGKTGSVAEVRWVRDHARPAGDGWRLVAPEWGWARRFTTDAGGYVFVRDVTHWMPLPVPAGCEDDDGQQQQA